MVENILNMKKIVIRLTSTLALGAMLSGLVVFEISAADIGKLTQSCTDCHGKDGVSSESDIPIIAGFSEQYMLDSMAIYKDEERPCLETEYRAGENKGSKTDMCEIANDLSDEEVEEIAEFYASKKFVAAKQTTDPEKAARGEKIHEASCEKCHEDGGRSSEDDAGILAGQWMSYLEQSFKDYAAGDRAQAKKMKPKMEKLDGTDTENLIHYYGSLQ